MPANKEAFLRYRIINKMLTNKNKPYPSMDDIINELEDKLGKTFSESTIQKDIKAMKEDELLGYKAPIKFHRSYMGYYYTDENFSISEVPLNHDDIEAIEFAAKTLNQFKDIRLFKEFSAAVEKIFNAVSIHSILDEEEVEEIIQFEKVPYYSGSQWISILSKWIKERQVLEIQYQRFSDNETRMHVVHPILLKEYRNRWYLISMLEKNNHIVIYALDRIKEIHLRDLAYRKHPNFSTQKYFKYAYGITVFEKEPEKVIVKANKIQSLYFKTQPIHDTQELIEEQDDYSIFQLTVGITTELVMDILSFGASVEVIEPSHLRELLIEKYKESIALYK